MKDVRYIRKEKGVSPVIATILMVAITVVLAATVYIMVSGYMTGVSTTNVQVSFTKVQNSEYNYTLNIVKITGAPSKGILWKDITIKLTNGTAVISQQVTLSSGKFHAESGGTVVHIIDGPTSSPDGKIGPEDIIYVQAGSGAEFQLLYKGSVIGDVQFP